MDRLAETLSSLLHLDLEGEIVEKQPYASCLGGSCEVYKAWSTKHNKKVAVKQIRAFLRKDHLLAKSLAKEIRIWSKLEHQNVLPLLGFFTEGDDVMPSLVAEWMEKGSLHDFMKCFPRGGVEACTMIRDISAGLAYLHSKDVIHADLKAQNILISASNTPLLADFGLSLALSHSQLSYGITTSSTKGTVRWMAIELLPSVSGDEPSKHDKNTDMWALGMVIYELLSWDFPYNNKPNDVLVLMAIVNGELPEKPDRGLDHRIFDSLWEVARSCWNAQSATRPSAEFISDYLTNDILSNFSTGLHSLLVQSTTSDTLQVKAITAQINRDYYNNPACISALAQILASSPEIAIRQLAANDLRKCVCQRDYALWIALPQTERKELKDKLPQIVINETTKSVRQASARVVAALASHELALGTWPTFLSLIERCCMSDVIAHREVGSNLLFAVLEDGLLTLKGLVSPNLSLGALSPILQTLFALLRGLVSDPESPDVRITAVRALGEIAEYMESDNIMEVNAYQALLPAMLKVLETDSVCTEEGCDSVENVLDVFKTLLVLDVPILSANSVPLLVLSFLKVVEEESRDPKIRIMALDALEWTIKLEKSKIQFTEIASGLLNRLFSILASPTLSEKSEFNGTTEDDDGDNDLKNSPARTALRIIDTITSVLHPTQFVPPLLRVASEYMLDQSRYKRRAALLALSASIEGYYDYIRSTPDSGANGSGSGNSFLDTQVWPLVEICLRDGDADVRRAACTCVGDICDLFEEACTNRHKTLIPALMILARRGERTQREACVALDAFLKILPVDIIGGYLDELLPGLISLLEDDTFPEGASDRQRKARLKDKSVVIGAIDSAAHAAKGKFVQYFEVTMRRMESFLVLGRNATNTTKPVFEAEVELRVVAMDAVGTFAEAVDKDAFRPYLPQMMRQAFQGLEMGSTCLRECSFLFFGVMARVYGEEFALGGKEQGGEGWLAGVVAALVNSLQQDDSGLVEDAEAFDLDEIVQDSSAPTRRLTHGYDREVDVDVEDIEEDEEDDVLEAKSAIAAEKEMAADTVGILFTMTGVHFFPYVEQCVIELIELFDHDYERTRKSSVEGVFEIIRTCNSLGKPAEWKPGLPGKEGTGVVLDKSVEDLVGYCLPALLKLYGTEDDMNVVITLCVGLAKMINSLGPAVLDANLNVISDIAIQILEQKALCQQESDRDDDEEEPSKDQIEFDSLLISSAEELVASLANVLGPEFAITSQRFFPIIWKLYKKENSISVRSSAIVCFTDIISSMKSSISPFTRPLLELFYFALSDAADEVRSNAAFATGLLVEKSTVDLTPQYMHLLHALVPLFNISDHATSYRLIGRDNAVGAVSRLITRNTAAVPLAQILPSLLAALPLRNDYLENRPLFRCIFHLFRSTPQEIFPYLDQLLLVFAYVLDPARSKDQLDVETRSELLNLVTALNEVVAAKVHGAGLGPFVQSV